MATALKDKGAMAEGAAWVTHWTHCSDAEGGIQAASNELLQDKHSTP